MTRDDFWEIVERTHSSDPDAHCVALVGEVAALPEDEIHAFGHWWDVAVWDAYAWDVWGAAYLIGGGASDDGFEYFRHWLVLQGRAVYDAARHDPDSLVAVTDGDDEYQYECYPAMDAWIEATGRKQDSDAYDAWYAAHDAANERLGLSLELTGVPTGEDWDFDDEAEMRLRLPRLAARAYG